MIFVDNAMKGITPLVVTGVSNGEHTVTLQKTGYQVGASTVLMMGETELVDIGLLLPGETPTPTQTINYEQTLAAIQQDLTEKDASIIAVETQVSEIKQTVETHGTQISNIVSETTPDYQATIAALQAKQAEQEQQIDILTATVNAIKALLGIS